MTTPIHAVPPVALRVSLPSRAETPTPQPTQTLPNAAAPAAQPAPDVKLTIGLAPSGDFYVYTLTDTATGRVLAELPRGQLEDVKHGDDYTAGSVVRTRA